MLKHRDYFSAFVTDDFDQYLERQRYCQYIVLFSTNWMAGNQTSGATSLKRSLCTMLLSFHLFFSLCLFLFVLSFLVLCVLSGFLRRLYYFYYVFVIKLFVFLSLRHFCSLFFSVGFLLLVPLFFRLFYWFSDTLVGLFMWNFIYIAFAWLPGTLNGASNLTVRKKRRFRTDFACTCQWRKFNAVCISRWLSARCSARGWRCTTATTMRNLNWSACNHRSATEVNV